MREFVFIHYRLMQGNDRIKECVSSRDMRYSCSFLLDNE